MNSPEPSHESVQRAPARRGRFRSRESTVLNALTEANKPLTAHEIAEVTDCALVTVRRHLKSLRRTGQVCITGRRPRQAADGSRLPSRSPNQYAPAPVATAS